MAIVNGYDAYVINPNILSEYNVDQSGEVVSAEVWKALWDLVLGALIKYDRAFIDIYRTLTDLNTELDNCIQRVDRIEEIYDALAERMETLEKTWTELQATYNKIAGHYEDIKDIHDALKEGLVHYGVDAPTLKYTKLWVTPTQFPLAPLQDIINTVITSRVDADLDENSENPVQNKAIVNYLDEVFGYIGEELERLDDEVDLKVSTFDRTAYGDLEANKENQEAFPSVPAMFQYVENYVNTRLEALRTELQGDLDEIGDLVGGETGGDSGTGEVVTLIETAEYEFEDSDGWGFMMLPIDSIPDDIENKEFEFVFNETTTKVKLQYSDYLGMYYSGTLSAVGEIDPEPTDATYMIALGVEDGTSAVGVYTLEGAGTYKVGLYEVVVE